MAKKPKYYWWHGSDLTAFFTKGAAMSGQKFRVEFHPDEEKGLKIIPGGAAKASAEDAFNVVHTCPPDCPE
jgi:hypothetical protein